jgi:hypothetical protein
VIHPAQIEPVQKAYSPTQDAISHAAAVVQAHEQHQSQGEGAFEFQGSMIGECPNKILPQQLYRVRTQKSVPCLPLESDSQHRTTLHTRGDQR